ncbi:hypothetical protein P43SY_000612 [Pythium insidiosum]|uniref:Uncharacterized protein n=1 Tax=Pythium insidiosum TaxID=114742 RepID=A0AAD5Q6A6_PYTIN|nr:hypothetical protein P43SY_000612 [Pythium insidiosum]
MKTSSVAAALLPLVAALQLAAAEPNCTVPSEDRVISTTCGPVICGSNNITYDNEDAFEWSKCDFPGLTEVARGACPGNETDCSKSYRESGSDAGNSDGSGVPSPTKENIVGSGTPAPTKSSVAAGIQASAAIAIISVGAIFAAVA